MIISNIMGGVGNQLFQYAVGRRLAHKLGVELKLWTNWFRDNLQRPMSLYEFNVKCSEATPEEYRRVLELNARRTPPLGQENAPRPRRRRDFMPEVLDYPDDVFLYGYFQDEQYFIDIEDIIRDELTLKTPPRGAAAMWLDKIRDAECPVSLHVRHGDYATRKTTSTPSNLLPIDYYRECVDRLKQSEPRMTLFVFSDDLPWTRENINFGVPIEFVDGCARDLDEMFLMSQCRHNIIANSTFSWWGAWLNRNPNKKVFVPHPWGRSMSLDSPDHCPDDWIRVPVDFDKNVPVLKLEPIYSIVLVTHNDERFVVNCLRSLLSQNYRFYEIIVVDDASTDKTFDLIRQLSAQSDKIIPMRFDATIGRSSARNQAILKARGQYIIFADARSLMFSNVLHEFFEINVEKKSDVFHSTRYLSSDPNGSIELLNRKFRTNDDAAFGQNQYLFNINGLESAARLELLASGGVNNLLGSYSFRRKFLIDNGIMFERTLGHGADTLFLIECFLRAKIFWLTPMPSQAVLERFKPQHWDAELDAFIRRIKKCLSPLVNEPRQEHLALMFVRQYLDEF